MKREIAFALAVVVSLWLCSFSVYGLPEGAVARLGKGAIGEGDIAIAFSPDGAMLAVATSIGVYLYDPLTGEEMDLIAANDWVSCIAFSTDGSLLAGGSGDDTVKLWDVSSRQLVYTLAAHTGDVNTVAFSPDGKWLFSGSRDGTVRGWNVSTGVGGWSLIEVTVDPASIAFSPDGNLLAIMGYRSSLVELLDMTNGQLVDRLGHSDLVNSISFSPDGSLLASAVGGHGEGGTVLRDVSSRQVVATLQTGDARSVVFSPDSSMLAVATGAELQLWDVSSRQLVDVLIGHTGHVISVAFSPDGSLLASGSVDETVKLWDVSSRQLVDTLTGYSRWYVSSVAFSPDGSMLAGGYKVGSIFRYGKMQLWDVSSRQLIDTLPGNSEWVWSVAFSPDGSLLASACLNDAVELWDVASRQLVDTLPGAWVWCVAFSPDGSLLASGNGDGTLRLWDVSSRQLVDTLHMAQVCSVAFSPDGGLLAGGGHDGTVELWDVSSRQLIDTLTGHSDWVWSVAFSPDGSLLASGSDDGTVKLWDVSSQQLVDTLTTEPWGPVSSVAFSPDGSLLAVGSADKTLKLWDVSSRQLVDTLTGHASPVSSVAFSPDGSLLASASNDCTILLWSTELSYDLQMEPGWNVISLPLRPLDPYPAAVLASIDTKYSSVWAYDPDSGWSVYMPGFPSNLLSMEVGRGYWVEMDQDQSETLTFEGTVQVSTDITLWGGKWNLVGYSSLITRTAEACMSGVADFINSVWGYNPTTGWSVYAQGGPGNLIFMKPGCGYWIKADETCTWNVNAPAQ